jgi:hypothetical protein
MPWHQAHLCSVRKVLALHLPTRVKHPQVFFCFAQSVASTRWMIQDELRLETTKCDNCIIGEPHRTT